MRAYGRIKVARAQGVETITLNNPDKRNAIGPRMTNELLWALSDVLESDEVRSVVITGEGKAFCSGGDFGEMAAGAAPSDLPYLGDYADLLFALVRCDKPVVARVNGLAMGGGLGIVAASTFAVATTDVRLGTPEINAGLFPMMIMAVLARQVPRRRLLQMMLLGETFEAGEALRLGLLNEVVEQGALDGAVKRITDGIASKSPSTVRLGLRAFGAQDDLDLASALPLLRERFAECIGTDDAREGLMAFLQKRPPTWTGK
jgi:enoyl-CoA hydratase/carnithine racemase